MMFTSGQRQAVESGGSLRMTIEGIECIVVRADLFEKARTLLTGELTDDGLTDELTDDGLRAMLAPSYPDSWDHPEIDIYGDYAARSES